MMSCKEISLLMSKSQDTRLDWREQLAVRIHLLYCRGCARLRGQLQFLRTAARHWAESPGPEQQLSSAARQRIRSTLDRQ